MRNTILLTNAEAALQLRVTPGTLANWRSKNTGPPFTRVGGKVAYTPDDIAAYLASRRQTPEQPNIEASR
jgi:hypothetical protein